MLVLSSFLPFPLFTQSETPTYGTVPLRTSADLLPSGKPGNAFPDTQKFISWVISNLAMGIVKIIIIKVMPLYFLLLNPYLMSVISSTTFHAL